MSAAHRTDFLWRLFAAAAFVGLSSAGWALSRVCLFEVGAIFLIQALLILSWWLARRPLILVTGLYLAACYVFLVRETVLTLTGGMPCGFLTFGSSCVETRCAERNRILWFDSSCKRQECVRSERHEASRVFAVDPADLHNLWLATGLAASWSAMAVSVWQVQRWRATAASAHPMSGPAGTGSRATEYVALVLAVPATYGVCAAHALRGLFANREDSWGAEAMMDAAELFSALALSAFQRLLELYVDAAVHGGASKTDLDRGSLEALEQVAQLRRSFQSLIAMGLRQYVCLVLGCNALEVFAKVWDWRYPARCGDALAMVAQLFFPHYRISLTLDEGILGQSQHTRAESIACEDLWNTVSVLMVAANFFTCSIALCAVQKYEQTFADDLQPVRPFWKFWGVKGLLSVNSIQTMVLMAMGFFVSDEAHTSEHLRTFLNAYLICIEALLLAILNVFAYPPAQASFVRGGDAVAEGLDESKGIGKVDKKTA